jgi:hypothetical protein
VVIIVKVANVHIVLLIARMVIAMVNARSAHVSLQMQKTVSNVPIAHVLTITVREAIIVNARNVHASIRMRKAVNNVLIVHVLTITVKEVIIVNVRSVLMHLAHVSARMQKMVKCVQTVHSVHVLVLTDSHQESRLRNVHVLLDITRMLSIA